MGTRGDRSTQPPASRANFAPPCCLSLHPPPPLQVREDSHSAKSNGSRERDVTGQNLCCTSNSSATILNCPQSPRHSYGECHSRKCRYDTTALTRTPEWDRRDSVIAHMLVLVLVLAKDRCAYISVVLFSHSTSSVICDICLSGARRGDRANVYTHRG